MEDITLTGKLKRKEEKIENKDFEEKKQSKEEINRQRKHEKELYDSKNANLTHVENIDKQLLDPDISQRKREKLEIKRKKLLANDKGVSNKTRNMRIMVLCIVAASIIGIVEICLNVF